MKARVFLRRALPALGAGLAAALLLLLSHGGLFDTPRELYFDRLTQWAGAPRSPEVVVVDIDRASFAAAGTTGWGRADMARLIRAIAAEKPAAIAVDFLFSRDCIADNAANAALAEAIGAAPVVLGFLIADVAAGMPHPAPPVAVRRPLTIPELWFIDGAETSCPLFQDRARSAAAAFLVGDEDGRVRRVQAYAILDSTPYPALAIEAVRIAAGAPTPVLGGEPATLRFGEHAIALDPDGDLRFSASDGAAIAARTLSASEILAGTAPGDRLADRLVFVGSSLPTLGGLRQSASMPLEPSVQIHADIASGILTGFVPSRDPRLRLVEAAFAAIAALVLVLATRGLRPVAAAAAGVGAIVLVLAGSLAVHAASGHLTDGAGIAVALAGVLVLSGTLNFARARRAEAAARRKFSQYLPQSVVSRFLDAPESARMAGEERQVTALFTDIEGFSTLAQRIGPRELIGLLDRYFAEVTALVTAHGGMVDKIVGDAVHALFNAPEDLDGHVEKAIACARAIRSLTEAMRARPDFARNDFGRTRIGIETGIAVLGEVGAGGRLDYTAHGDAVNLAARLQDANKFLGTAICIGPQAAREYGRPLRALGIHEIRGFGSMDLFTIDDAGEAGP
ncbi:CHASE2 domain-containing protein [Ensifer soli]|uniref:CHASE2 domain-containing protein n=1 Tax=Ciceribacter sp. sgz301302 TaxID=3342379 RepID=UPI0035B801DF